MSGDFLEEFIKRVDKRYRLIDSMTKLIDETGQDPNQGAE